MEIVFCFCFSIIIISSVGRPLFSDQERVFCLYFIPMEIIIISSRELTGNLHKPLILVSYQVVKRLIPKPFNPNLNHLVPDHVTKEFNCGSQLGTLCYVSSLHCYSHVHSNKKAAFNKYQCRPGLWTDNHFLLKIYYCC